MKIEYDKPIEVSKEKYNLITKEFSGIVAHRIEDGKYYIKVWMMKYAPIIQSLLS